MGDHKIHVGKLLLVALKLGALDAAVVEVDLARELARAGCNALGERLGVTRQNERGQHLLLVLLGPRCRCLLLLGRRRRWGRSRLCLAHCTEAEAAIGLAAL